MDINELPEEYRKQAEAQLKNRTSVCYAKQKPDRQAALGKKAKVPQFDTSVYFRCTVWKTGSNWDAENIETKSILDGLVKNGVIRDDTIKEVPKIFKQGIRVKTKKEERTEIEVIDE